MSGCKEPTKFMNEHETFLSKNINYKLKRINYQQIYNCHKLMPTKNIKKYHWIVISQMSAAIPYDWRRQIAVNYYFWDYNGYQMYIFMFRRF